MPLEKMRVRLEPLLHEHASKRARELVQLRQNWALGLLMTQVSLLARRNREDNAGAPGPIFLAKNGQNLSAF